MFSLFYSLLNRLQISYIFPQLGKTERCYPKGQRCCRVRKAHVYSQRPAWWTPTFGEMFFTRTLPAINEVPGDPFRRSAGKREGSRRGSSRTQRRESPLRPPRPPRDPRILSPRPRNQTEAPCDGFWDQKATVLTTGMLPLWKDSFSFLGKKPSLCAIDRAPQVTRQSHRPIPVKSLQTPAEFALSSRCGRSIVGNFQG